MRDAFVIAGLAVVAVGIGGSVFWYSRGAAHDTSYSAAASQPATVSVPFTKLASGASSPVAERKNYLITSEQQLRDLWKMVDKNGTPPAVDFEKQYVVAVFAGKKPTAGYAISVSKVEDDGQRVVKVTVAEPGKDCVLAQVITSPYEIVAVPTTQLQWGHEDAVATGSCGS